MLVSFARTLLEREVHGLSFRQLRDIKIRLQSAGRHDWVDMSTVPSRLIAARTLDKMLKKNLKKDSKNSRMSNWMLSRKQMRTIL
jgi:hypothetical protein